jgi:hypothetical protein
MEKRVKPGRNSTSTASSVTEALNWKSFVETHEDIVQALTFDLHVTASAQLSARDRTDKNWEC